MKRREFITLLGGAAAAWPLAARAQQRDAARRCAHWRLPGGRRGCRQQPRRRSLQTLQQLGWIEGRNLRLDVRWGGGNPNASAIMPRTWSLSPRMSSWSTGVTPLAALLQATRTVPIVFVNVADPVGGGFVATCRGRAAMPRGSSQYEYSLSAKWLELLKEIAPGVTRALVFRDPAITAGIGQFAVIQSVASSVGIEVSPANLQDVGEIESSIAETARAGQGGVILTGSALTVSRSGLITRLAIQHKLPADLPPALLCRERLSDLLWTRCPRPVRARRGLHRSHPQRRETGRSAGAGADEVRTGDQP